MNVKTLLFLSAGMVVCSASALTVTDVSACQRYPWNNFIDIDFTIGGAGANDQFKIDVKASYLGDTRIMDARTFVTDPVVKTGTRRITWDLGKDYPGFKADDLRVAVTASPFTNGTDGVYMVIDLSGGKDAVKYPVHYTTKPPKHSVNAEDPCKTTEMWLKRIKCGSYMFGKGDAVDSTGNFKINLTKDFYMGIFECTQQQWAQVTGEWPSIFSNRLYRATRPCENIVLPSVFGHYMWPKNQNPSDSSIVKKIRVRTGLSTFNLSTEAQWEWANRCGHERGRNPCYQLSEIRYGISSEASNSMCSPEEGGTACVGTYKPNSWGLYEMFGNVAEICLDAGVSSAKLLLYYGTTFCGLTEGECSAQTVEVNDPIGGPIEGEYKSGAQYYHVGRGSDWMKKADYLYHFSRWTNVSDNFKDQCRGVRFVVTCE